MTEKVAEQTYGFKTEVKQLLKLMIHSLYSNREIFLRELISNAADAADKIRFKALEDNSLYGDDSDLKVQISLDKDAKTITISDNGIGMDVDEINNNLGTIAKSGTSEFFSNLTGDQAKDSQLIGQFGVGFYSAFIVADRVSVKSRKAGASSSDAVMWESTGEGEYSVTSIEKETRGTEITLHLREKDQDLLDDWKVRQIITKYSDHLNIPVQIWVDAIEEVKDDEGKVTTEGSEAHFETINSASALWTRSKSEIKDEEYNEFYKHIGNDYEDPLTWSHNKVEGKSEYTSLLYIPARAPFDLWNREKQHGLKLYVQRVFIMDDAEEFMPLYLRFVKGVLDSNNLPLNVSREILQDTDVTRNLKTACTKRVLSMLEKLAKKDDEKYLKFYEQFGQVLKEGPAEDFANKEKIAGLLRFSSTRNDNSKQNVSLDAYIEKMPENQKDIYYITADTYASASTSAHLEIFKQKDIEVLLLTDRIDEWLLSHLSEYKDKKLVSAAKGDLDLDYLKDEKDIEKEKDVEKESSSLIERIKEVLKDSVEDVRVTHKLTNVPTCVVAGAGGMSAQMLKLLEATGQNVPEQKYIFEVNPHHEIIKNLNDEADEDKFKTYMEVLLDQAILAEKGSLDNPNEFIQKINSLLA